MEKRKRLGILIVFVSVSFLGLLWTQYLWIRNNIKQSNNEFDQKVNALVVKVVREVENENYCVDMFSKVDLPQGQTLRILAMNDSTQKADTIPLYLYFQNANKVDSLYSFDSLLFSYPTEIQMNLDVTFLEHNIVNPNPPIHDFHGFERRFEDNSLNVHMLDTLLHREFKKNDIDRTFHFLLQSPRTGNQFFTSNAEISPDDIRSGIRSIIFNNSRYYEPLELFVFFPDRNTHSITSNLITILSSFVLVVMIVLLFVFFFRMLVQERRLSEMKVDFVNNITHEFRTPLSNIKLAANALRKDMPQTGQKLIEIIEEENERLQKGIDLALTTSLLNKDEILLDREEKDIHELLRRLVQGSLLVAEEKNGSIHLHLKSTHHTLFIDELHMTNVFSNLIYNALKYSNASPAIHIDSELHKNELHIAVKDNGIGIAERDLPYIFDRFYRVSTQNRHETRGYGIGLYYVKMIVEAHGGRISATSSIGKGTTFNLYLPTNANE